MWVHDAGAAEHQRLVDLVHDHVLDGDPDLLQRVERAKLLERLGAHARAGAEVQLAVLVARDAGKLTVVPGLDVHVHVDRVARVVPAGAQERVANHAEVHLERERAHVE